jgi:hypothetical protein
MMAALGYTPALKSGRSPRIVTHMETKDYADAALAELFARARTQFGDAVKGLWFCDADPCPGCGFPIDAIAQQPVWRPSCACTPQLGGRIG